MSSEATPDGWAWRTRQWFRSLPVRLTCYYAVVLLAALGVCYGVSYWRLSSLASRRADAYLLSESDECRRFYELRGLSAVTDEAKAESEAEGLRDVYFRITGEGGKTLFETSSPVPETHTYQFTNPHPHNVSRTRQRSRRRALRIFCLAAIVVTMMMMGVSQCVVLSIDGHGHHFVAAVTAAAYISNPTRIDPFHFQSS